MTTQSLRYGDLFTERDSRNLRVFNIWLFAALILFMTATVVLAEKFVAPGGLAWSITILAIFLAVMAVRAYMHFLRNADELLRKIQLEGLALGFGVGVVFLLGYRLLERLGAWQLDTSDPVVIFVGFWALGQYLGVRRYTCGAMEEQP